MPPTGFVLWFTGLPSVTKTTIASVTAHELKQRGCNIGTLDGQPSVIDWTHVLETSKGDEDAYIRHLRRICASGIHNEVIVLPVLNSKTLQMPEDLRYSVEAFVEVEIGIPKYEEGEESRNAVNGDRAHEQLNLAKIVLHPDAEPAKCVADILSKLEDLELIAGSTPKESSYDEDDEATIRRRLEALGYL